MKFYKFYATDYEDIVDISKNIWDGNDYLPNVFHKWVDEKDGCFLGLVLNNKVVAVGKYTVLKDKQGWLEGLRVHCDYRGRQFAHAISDLLFNKAREDLRSGKITNIAMCTHKDTTASIKMMEAKNFKLDQSCLIVFKEYDSIKDKNLDLNDYKIEKWNISYQEFKNLDYFKKSNNKITYGFTFYNMCEEIYDELVKDNCLVLINGYRCIVKVKGSPAITCIDNTIDGINTATNYCLLKHKTFEAEIYIANVYEDLIKDLSKNEYISLTNFEDDCLYYVYKEQ
ncbi:MAG: GNAT family N-acetyltransferase [Romboutsia sp.]|uniref:GNAT family N-acetyltransferase n=1 Tax=Romboutsia sp. TaxID=1965302 RepID=UPI003F2E6A3D